MIYSARVFLCATSLMLITACSGGGGPVEQPFETGDETDSRRDDDQPSLPDDTPQDEVDGDVDSAPNDAEIPDDPIEDLFDGDAPDDPEQDDSVLDETLADSTEETIALTGLALVVVDGARVIVVRDGTFESETEISTLNGSPFVLTNDVPGAFEVAASYVQNDGPGIVGIATEVANMPTTQSATFTGGATGLVITGDAGFELRNGISVVAVDFGTGAVSVDLTDFTSVSLLSDKLENAPFEGLTLTNATISENGFVGGTLETIDGVSVADIVGSNARLESQGQFFGYDETALIPAEVGGIVFTQGDDGQIFGSFIAN